MLSARDRSSGRLEHFNIRAIFVGGDGADYQHLLCIFRMMEWNLVRLPVLRDALKRAATAQTTHVLYDHVPGDQYGWIEALEAINSLPNPPSFILMSRLGDEQLWAEVLNRGGYDLLLKPYNSLEVTRVVLAARQHRLRRTIEFAVEAGRATPMDSELHS